MIFTLNMLSKLVLNSGSVFFWILLHFWTTLGPILDHFSRLGPTLDDFWETLGDFWLQLWGPWAQLGPPRVLGGLLEPIFDDFGTNFPLFQ